MSKKVKTDSKSMAAEHKKTVLTCIRRASSLLQRRSIVMDGVKTSLRSYFSSDSKDVKTPSLSDREIKLIDDEIKISRDMIRGFKGFSKLNLDFYSSLTLNSNGSGTMANVVTLDPSTLSEWTSCAALFDEYRVVGGVYHYSAYGPVVVPGLTTNVISKGVVGYDPSDATAYVAVVSGCQDEQHLLYDLPVAGSNGVSTVTIKYGESYRFRFKVPSGTVQTSTAVSDWQPTNTTGGTLKPYGYLKFFSETHLFSTAVVGGIIQWHMEFRMRE